jgi:hypothetical protein
MGDSGSTGATGPTGAAASIELDDVPVASDVSTLNFSGGVSVRSDGGGQVTVAVPFGSEYQALESNGQSATTSGAYVQKLTLTTSTLSGGQYYVGWYFEAKPSEGEGSKVVTRVQLDDTLTIGEVEQDAPSSTIAGVKASWEGTSGFQVVALAGGKHRIDVDYKAQVGPLYVPGQDNSVSIRRARVALWKVR